MIKKVLFTATVDSHILQFHLPFLKMFKENGYEVHVATSGNKEIPYCDVKHIISFERSPFKRNNLRAIRKLKQIINEEKFDIIHTHTPMGSAVTRLAAKKARKKYKTRIIYTAHGFHFFKGAPLKNWILFYPVEKYLSKYTDTLILINKEDYDLAKKKFKKCKDIQYVPGVGIDEEKFNFIMSVKEKQALRKSLGLKENDFVMIYPAEISKRKRQIWLIETLSNLFKEHSDMHLLLPGQDSLNGQCQKLVKNLKLENQIHFLGYREDIPKLLKISNLSLSAAKQEGLPVNIMEAMYIGLPVVASNCRGNRDLIKNNVNGYLIDLTDQSSFSKAVLKIYLNSDLYNKFILSNREIIKKYLLPQVIEKMFIIYNRKKVVMQLLYASSLSGAENIVSEIAKNISDNYISYYCSPCGSIQKRLKEYNVKYIPIRKLNYISVRKVIKKYKPDIIHAHDFKASCIASLFYKNCLIISHLHQNPVWMRKINIKTFIYGLTIKKYSKIAIVSRSICNESILKSKMKNKVVVIPNYVDKNKIISLSKEKYENKYDLCFFGRLDAVKNPHLFLKIMYEYEKKYFTHLRCCMIGNGECKKELEKMIQELSLQNRIDLLGYQENPFKIIKNCKIIIMPSVYEGFGLSAVESMCLNIPVLNSGVGGLREIFDNFSWYICENFEDYLTKINDLFSKSYNNDFSTITSKYTNRQEWLNKVEQLYENK